MSLVTKFDATLHPDQCTRTGVASGCTRVGTQVASVGTGWVGRVVVHGVGCTRVGVPGWVYLSCLTVPWP